MKIDRFPEILPIPVCPQWRNPMIEQHGDQLEISELAKALSKIQEIPDRTIEIPTQLEPGSLKLALQKMLRENF